MRLWSVHPRYLDARGLVALWREALLAKAVLGGRTKGYRQHPQLTRFRAHPAPRLAINAYLQAIHEEATARGYHFDRRKIGRINGLRHKRIIPAPWNDVMYVAHIFDHPLYNAYINAEKWPVPPKGKRGKPRANPLPASPVPASPTSSNGHAPVVVPPRTSQPASA